MYINHEIGHYIQYNLLSKKEWDDYRKEYKKSKSLGSLQFNREYSMENEEEWFADDVMYIQEWSNNKIASYQHRKRIALVKKYLSKL